MEPVDIGTIILAPGDKSVDIPLSTIKWSISNPDGEKVTEELIYSLPEEVNKRRMDLQQVFAKKMARRSCIWNLRRIAAWQREKVYGRRFRSTAAWRRHYCAESI